MNEFDSVLDPSTSMGPDNPLGDANAALRLARFLKEFVRLRSTIVRDLSNYETVLWLSDFPQHADCWCGAWAADAEDADSWLEVRKQKFEPTPSLPESLRVWIDTTALTGATPEAPALRERILKEAPSVANAEEGINDEVEETAMVEHYLRDHPDIVALYDAYRPRWELWSANRRGQEAVQEVYSQLFRLHTQLVKQGELYEVVLGLGLIHWEPGAGGVIRRHCVVARTEIRFDASSGLIQLAAPGDGARLALEDDMLEASIRPDQNRSDSVRQQLAEIGDGVWDGHLVNDILPEWATALSARSQWSSGLSPQRPDHNHPAVSFAPAIIMRRRQQTGMMRIYEEIVRRLEAEASSLPHGWRMLFDDNADSQPAASTGLSGRENTSVPSPPTEVYFPLPANTEQRRIVDAIARHPGVLVQGPPGTGKSHTIANLMCHLLATGKRILITAETSRALKVLKGKLPEELQPLCVSLLGQGGDAFAELNAAVQSITTRQSAFSRESVLEQIQELEARIHKARMRVSAIDNELLTLRRDETILHSIGSGAYHGTASSIASRVASEVDRFNWLRLPEGAANSPSVSHRELCQWLSVRRRFTDADIHEQSLTVPEPQSLPSPTAFADLVRAEQAAFELLKESEQLRQHRAFEPIQQLPPSVSGELAGRLQALDSRRSSIGSADHWLQGVVGELLLNRSARWVALLELTDPQLRRAEALVARLGNSQVLTPAHLDPRKVKSDASSALEFLKSGGQWKKLLLLTPPELSGKTYLCTEVLVDGVGARDVERLDVVCCHLELEFCLEDLRKTWVEAGASPFASDRRLMIAELRERATLLERCIQYASAALQVARALDDCVPRVPAPDWLSDEVRLWIKLTEVAAAHRSAVQTTESVEAGLAKLSSLLALHDVHPVVPQIEKAIRHRDVAEYSRAMAVVERLETDRGLEQERRRVESQLEAILPGLIDSVAASLNNPDWDARFADWEAAWQWALADQWLRRRADFEYQARLWAEREREEQNRRQAVTEVAAARAWTFFFARLTPPEAAALRSWREAVRAIGKGTGKSARQERLRQDARQYMDKCRDAIPIWIMPRYLVAEMIDPTPERYDLVIVDEASQLGIESLFLFYISKQIVVVGDDQQISPYGIGTRDADVQALQQTFLTGIPHQHALSAQSSLYANAKIRFNQNIVLREHFRCMPEIIQFSNDLCYASNGTPLDPLRTYPPDRLEPLVVRHVSEGYRTGASQYVQNPPEADAIVEQIAACIEDPRYAGATMGVISLQGETQARLIEQKLLSKLDPAVIEARRLICGDAYAFQGDERNIIFLSLVAAKSETRIGVLSGDSARQRFNVAASRAQDQLWLFHTVQLEDLSRECMRYRILSYMLDPARQPTIEQEQVFDSEFERAVYQRLTARGYHVRSQVAVGDPTSRRYRIDLVVEGIKGRLAVECDGDQWHGPERHEQDMSRQRDLERAGWIFERVRGSEFYRDPERALQPVWSTLDRLEIRPGGIGRPTPAPPAPIRRAADDREVSTSPTEVWRAGLANAASQVDQARVESRTLSGVTRVVTPNGGKMERAIPTASPEDPPLKLQEEGTSDDDRRPPKQSESTLAELLGDISELFQFEDDLDDDRLPLKQSEPTPSLVPPRQQRSLGDAIGDVELGAPEEMIVFITRGGFIKRVSTESYREQRRGGKGALGLTTRESDDIAHILVASTDHLILFFTNRGRVYGIRASQVPQSSRSARGTAVMKLVGVEAGESVTATVPIETLHTDGYLVMGTNRGEVKRSSLAEFKNLRSNGLNAFDLEEGDTLRWVHLTSGVDDVLMVTQQGQTLRFSETTMRAASRNSGGVRGILLEGGDCIVAMEVARTGGDVLIVGKRGYGKRTPLDDFTRHSRGGKGMIGTRITEKSGHVADAKIVNSKDRLLLSTERGLVIKLSVTDVPEKGRAAEGVRLVRLDDGDEVRSVERIPDQGN